MKFKITLLILALILFAIVYFALVNLGHVMKREKLTTGEIVINDRLISVEIARTGYQQIQGLGNREALDENSGMLFVYPDLRIREFWMKGMEFPLDIIWIQEDTVVGLATNLPAPENDQRVLPAYASPQEVNYVLEVNAGFAELHNIQIGDAVIIKAP